MHWLTFAVHRFVMDEVQSALLLGAPQIFLRFFTGEEEGGGG